VAPDRVDKQAAAELLARIASIKKVEPAQCDSLVGELKQLLPDETLRHLMFRYRMADRLRVSAMKSGDPRPDEHYEKSKWRLEAKDAEEREYRALVGVLEQLHKLSCRYLRPFLDHRRTTLLVAPHVTLAADGRAVHEVDELIVGKRG